ncbi:MAG TPA: GNAT family N-acetyltransferase [Hyphomicrobiaceae bacterium]|nr:GNAT family N-acetyltransferase [Hyphomicrobiaceae bacterium]
MRVTDRVRARRATKADAAILKNLQEASLRVLAAEAYDRAALESFIRHAGTMDGALIEDGTFFVLELGGEIVACGGWTSRAPSYEAFSLENAGNAGANRATVRSIYVDPGFARQGLGTRVMQLVERDIAAAAYEESHLTATLNAMPLYGRLGYRPSRIVRLELPDRRVFTGVAMSKPLAAPLAAGTSSDLRTSGLETAL